MALQLTTASSYPAGFNNITIRGIPVTQSHPGQVFWVSDDAPLLPGQIGSSDGNPGTFNAPFSSLQYAISRTVPMRGDIIFVKPGHTETISSATLNVPGATATASALTHYSNGVAIIGLGSGSMKPCLNFSAAAAAVLMGCTPATMATATVSTAGVLTVPTLSSGTILVGMQVFGSSQIIPGTFIMSQLTGAAGGVGTYQLSDPPALAVTSFTAVGAMGCDNAFVNFQFRADFADVASAFKMTAAGYARNLTIERCEFRDASSVLNFVSLVTSAATTANNMDGLNFLNNRIMSTGTTAATTAIKFSTAQDNVVINDNFGNWAVLDNTAAMLATGANSVTNFEFGRNRLNKPNINSTTGSFISTSGTAWTGHCYDNYMYQLDATAGIWIDTGTKLAFSNNYSPITGAADKSGLINPAAV